MMTNEALRERIAADFERLVDKVGFAPGERYEREVLWIEDVRDWLHKQLAVIAETGELHPKGTGEMIGRLRAVVELAADIRCGPDASGYFRFWEAFRGLTEDDLGEPQAGEGSGG